MSKHLFVARPPARHARRGARRPRRRDRRVASVRGRDGGGRDSRQARRDRHRHAVHQHDPHAQHRRDPEGELGPPRDADGDGAGRLHAVAAASCASTPRTRSGPTATASCSRPATPRCCSTPAPPGARAGGRPRLRDGRRALGEPRRHQALPPARLASAPGHPEYRWTSGVETTTGPLGQGVATSIGMAVASKWMAAHFNRPGFELFDFDTYVIAGDGDMMEGVSNEAASFAGHQQLDNLCWIYDNNHISIDGHTSIAYSDDVAARFIGYGWDGRPGRRRQRPRAARRAPSSASAARTARPTLIIVDSHIGYGSPHKQDTAAAHGEPLGEEEVRETKRATAGPRTPSSSCPTGSTSTSPRGSGRAGATLRGAWEERFARVLEGGARAGRRARADAAPRAARGLGRRHPQLRRRPEGHRDAQGLEQGRERRRREGAVARRGLGRPHRLDLGAPDLRRGRRLRARRARTGASSTSASASTSRRRSRTASRCRRSGRCGRPT